ncbi:putative shikimate kinase/gluconokinase [Helianthus anomalus]
MATIQAPAGCCDLLLQKPFNSSSIRNCNISSSFSLTSINTTPLSLNNPRKLQTTSCSLLEDGVPGDPTQHSFNLTQLGLFYFFLLELSLHTKCSTKFPSYDKGSAVQALDVDPVLVVKKKAMEVSPGLKGTSIYLVGKFCFFYHFVEIFFILIKDAFIVEKLPGINSSMKTRLGKLLADSLRYYFFDSDNLVVEAAGGEAAAKQFLNTDKAGFRDSEVLFYCLAV